MQQFLSDGGLSKMLWIILVFCTGLGAVIIAAIEIVQGQAINQFVATILTGILAHAFTIGGSVNTATQLGEHPAGITTSTGQLSAVQPASASVTTTGGTSGTTH